MSARLTNICLDPRQHFLARALGLSIANLILILGMDLQSFFLTFLFRDLETIWKQNAMASLDQLSL
jgi:hypothetical protein